MTTTTDVLTRKTTTMKMKILSPNLLVEEIEPCLPFWTERLGFERHVEVNEGDRLGFVLLLRDGVQVMYQSRASLVKDLPELAKGAYTPTNVLYLNVEGIDEVERALEGLELEVPRRTTFYGATELGVREPGGTLVIFAEQGETPG